MLYRSQSFSPRRLVSTLFVLLLALALTTPISARGDDEVRPLAFVRDKFDALDKKGKFIAGAAAGFVGSRIAVGSAMTVVKVGAAAFVT